MPKSYYLYSKFYCLGSRIEMSILRQAQKTTQKEKDYTQTQADLKILHLFIRKMRWSLKNPRFLAEFVMYH